LIQQKPSETVDHPVHRTVVTVLIFAAFSALIISGCTREFRLDELEHLHVSRTIAHGYTPYVDFFEHHMPLHFSVLVPIYRVTGDSLPFFMISRLVFLGLMLFNCLIIRSLARRLMARAWANLAVLMYLVSLVTLEKGIDIRPDNIMVSLLLATTWLLSAKGCEFSEKHLVSGGLLAGLALFSSIKAIFPVAACVIAVLLTCRRPVKGVFHILMGIAASALTGILVIRHLGFLPAMIRYNFIENSRWTFRFSWLRGFGTLIHDDPLILMVWFFGASAALIHTIRCIRRDTSTPVRDRDPLTAMLLLSFVSMFAVIIFLLPNPYFHNYLYISVTGALLGVRGLSRIEGSMFQIHAARTAMIVAGILFIGSLNRMPVSRELRWIPQLETLFKVKELAGPEGRVLDDWTGRGTLCLPASFFPFMHQGIVKQFPREIRQDVMHQLNTAPPEVITMRSVMVEHFLSIHDQVICGYEFLPDMDLWVYTGEPSQFADLRKKPPKRGNRVNELLLSRSN